MPEAGKVQCTENLLLPSVSQLSMNEEKIMRDNYQMSQEQKTQKERTVLLIDDMPTSGSKNFKPGEMQFSLGIIG